MDSISATHRRQPAPLERWLRGLSALSPPPFLLGGTGHLILSAAEERRIAEALRESVLPQVLALAGEREIRLLTGLAPGADHVFSNVATAWLQAQRRPHHVIGLLPLPVAIMLDDWAEKARTQPEYSTATHERQRVRMQDEVDACDEIVHLLPPGTAPESLCNEPFRQLQYRRLAACLAEQSDALIAILRESSAAQPGGTAEVVAWRREPERIPADVTTLPLRPHDPRRHPHLFIVAPDEAAHHG